uniref:Polyprotein protein n=1 Tax=Solanum tuberosum TaxID=4113 RepID=M1DXK2_SOLTU
MGHLAHSSDVRATWLEAEIPWIIEWAILATLTPLRTSIHALITIVETCKSQQGATLEMTTLKVEGADLRKDVDYLKSTDITSLFDAVETQGVPGSSEMPMATTKDVPMAEVIADKGGHQ